MGRFDALLNPSKPPPTTSPSVDKKTSKPVNQQGSKEVNQQTSKPVNLQTSKEASLQSALPANQQASKQLKKFSSYLTEKSLKGLKRIAFETERKDYEVLQEAVDHYLQNK